MKKIIHIAGLGAVGSHLVRMIMEDDDLKDKVEIHGWDFDTVEEHNIANQHFSVGDIGSSKAEAMHNRFDIHTTIGKYPLFSRDVADIMVLAVDTMKARKEIYGTNASVHQHHLDTRLANGAIVSLANLGIARELNYEDEEADLSSPCQDTFHASKKLVLQSVSWLVEQIKSIVDTNEPAYIERRLIGGKTLDWKE